jgi:uncharacterized protein
MIFNIIVLSLIEIYFYGCFNSLLEKSILSKFVTILFILQLLVFVYALYKLITTNEQEFILRSAQANIYLGIVLTILVSKIIFCLGFFVQDLGRLLIGILNFVKAKISHSDEENFVPGRRDFFNIAAFALASIPFVGMTYGILKGKYNYKVKRLSLSFNDLPKVFSGLKIVQISDIHSGSLDDLNEVQKGVDLINSLNPDLVLFTGDLVNSEKDEINPYIDIFGSIKSRYGKYAILGNHDYYGSYKFEGEAKEKYMQDFLKKFEKMGFNLLKNENTSIQVGQEKINLIGVENWGKSQFFQKYGDLDKATVGLKKNEFNVLMSHDPTHWDSKVLDHDLHFHLTLSGHTHGAQFGIDMPGFKWSPVKYRYKRWMGLYEERGKYLYVNTGFGFLAFPGRVGIWPEITLLELNNV